MADGKGGCCIARWGGTRNMVDGGYNTSKMDMIMMKFRPIAPKPLSQSGAVSGTSEGCTQSSGSGGQQHAKGSLNNRGRRKMFFKENNNTSGTSTRKTSSKGRKRKSTSPDNHDEEGNINQTVNNDFQKPDLTLLPLFPEAPDLSPTISHQVQNMVPLWLNFDNNNPSFVDNYKW